jgi:hypothetical protein
MKTISEIKQGVYSFFDIMENKKLMWLFILDLGIIGFCLIKLYFWSIIK